MRGDSWPSTDTLDVFSLSKSVLILTGVLLVLLTLSVILILSFSTLLGLLVLWIMLERVSCTAAMFSARDLILVLGLMRLRDPGGRTLIITTLWITCNIVKLEEN